MATAHLIVSALVRREGQVLLVRERAPGDLEPTWMLPGGKVESGESLIEALRRELVEETGLQLADDPRIVFVSHVVQAAEGYVALTFACATEGDVAPNDPDGYVLEAAWVPEGEAVSRLGRVSWYDVAPLKAHLDNGASGGVSVVDRR